MNSRTDQQLLRDYTERRSESAFAELVRRHVDLIYSAALRMVCDSHLAEEVTQGAFVALARSAHQLTERAVLSGWLHRTAQNIAAQTVRTDVRRRAREQEAAAMNDLFATESDGVWEHIAPHLDAALGELSEADRDALLLRYFERKSAQQMAQVLGVSDEAAQKRVSRAVERLREFFAKRGVTVGVSGLVVVISANAVQTAPVGFAQSLSATALLKGVAASGSTLTLIEGTLKLMAWTNSKTAILVSAAVILVAGTATTVMLKHSQGRKTGSHFPRATWAFAGYTNPESAFLSGVWALGNDDAQNWLASLSPDEQARTVDRATANPNRDIIGARDPADFAKITGYRIVEKQAVSLDEVILKIYAEGLNQIQKFSIQRLGSEWKVGGPVQKKSNQAAPP